MIVTVSYVCDNERVWKTSAAEKAAETSPSRISKRNGPMPTPQAIAMPTNPASVANELTAQTRPPNTAPAR